jgi:hypothetical protein
MGHKTLARDLIDAHGMPMGVSSGLFNTDDALTLTEAARVYSVFVIDSAH